MNIKLVSVVAAVVMTASAVEGLNGIFPTYMVLSGQKYE